MDCLQADESPFIMKYTDSCYKAVLDANQKMIEEMNAYWIAQPELNEPEFIQQMQEAREAESRDNRQRFIPLWELGKYRFTKMIPPFLHYEERKKLLISSQEWLRRKQNNPDLKETQITEENIQSFINQAADLAGIRLLERFENLKMCKAFTEGYCELVLDTGNVRYNK